MNKLVCVNVVLISCGKGIISSTLSIQYKTRYDTASRPQLPPAMNYPVWTCISHLKIYVGIDFVFKPLINIE